MKEMRRSSSSMGGANALFCLFYCFWTVDFLFAQAHSSLRKIRPVLLGTLVLASMQSILCTLSVRTM